MSDAMYSRCSRVIFFFATTLCVAAQRRHACNNSGYTETCRWEHVTVIVIAMGCRQPVLNPCALKTVS
jgi:hypothetical protein